MGTTIRPEISKKNRYWIDKHRYYELKHFCLQYPTWKKAHSSLDVVMSMLDEGCVAIVPVDTTINPRLSSSYDILSLRTGKILEWYPKHVKVRVYNEQTGNKEDITLAKKNICITI